MDDLNALILIVGGAVNLVVWPLAVILARLAPKGA